MAAYIDTSTGRVAYVYNEAEGPGWHGMGQPIPAEYRRDPRKIAELAGCAFQVNKASVQFTGPDGKLYTVPNREAVYRADTMETFEVMSGNRFKVPQPVEYFEAFRDFLQHAGTEISSAGALKGGSIIFVNALIPGTDDVIGDDSDASLADGIKRYLCIGGGYGGDLAHFAYESMLRTVCWNTLSANLATTAKGKTQARMSHSAEFDPAALFDKLERVQREAGVQSRVFNLMANVKLSQDEAAALFCKALDVNPADVNRYDATGKPVLSTKLRNQLAALADAYTNGPGATLPSAAGTVWGALNAVTYYVDHKATVRDTALDGEQAARLASAQFGGGADTKARALKLALEAAKVTPDMLVAA